MDYLISIIALGFIWFLLELKAGLVYNEDTKRFEKLDKKQKFYEKLSGIVFYAWMGCILAWILTSII